MDILSLLNTVFGLLLFGLAWHIHGKYGVTRAACVLAIIAGLITYTSPVGVWMNDFLGGSAPLLLFLGTLFAIIVIVVDIKGKRKGADKPALVSFFLVPVFFVGFLAAVPDVLGMAGDGAVRIGERATQQLQNGR